MEPIIFLITIWESLRLLLILYWTNIQILAREWLSWGAPDTSCLCSICILDLLLLRHLLGRCLLERYGLLNRRITSDSFYLVKMPLWCSAICLIRLGISSLLILTLATEMLGHELLHTASVNIIRSEELRGLLQLEGLALECKVCESWEWVRLRVLNSVFGRGWARFAAGDHTLSFGLVAVRTSWDCILIAHLGRLYELLRVLYGCRRHQVLLITSCRVVGLGRDRSLSDMLVDTVLCRSCLWVLWLKALSHPVLAEKLALSDSRIKCQSLLLGKNLLGKFQIVLAIEQIGHLRVATVLWKQRGYRSLVGRRINASDRRCPLKSLIGGLCDSSRV